MIFRKTRMTFASQFSRMALGAACLILLGMTLPALAQSARVDRLVVTGVGVIQSELKKIESPDISTGQKYETTKARVARAGSDIALSGNTNFGVLLSVIGTPRGANVPVRVRWTYPGDGMTRPDTNKTVKFDEYDASVQIGGADQNFGWNVMSDYQRVVGVWTLEIWTIDKSRKLLQQTFNVTK